ncbi:MAG: hypothetical protein IJY83_04825 [Oscillospiraceae bacterium]|nr:hypothetical protein [Oscillospiraceae bacterium]
MSIFDSKKKKNKPDDEGFFDYDAYISGKEEKSSSDILKETDPDKLIEAIAEKKARDKISEDMKLPEEKKAEEAEKKEIIPEEKVETKAEEVKTDDVKSEEKPSETKEEKSKKKLFQKSEKADKKQDKKPVEEKVETPKEITPEIEEQPVPEMIEGAPEKESVSVSIEDIKSSFMNMPSPEKKEEEKSKKTQRKSFKLEKSEKTEKKQKEEKPKKVHSEKKKADDPFDELKIVFDSALDEDVSEIEEFSSEPETTSEPIIRKSFKRNSYLAIGVVVSVLALIGFVSSVLFVKGIAEGIANNTKQKEEFKSIVYPLVIIDSPEFDDITQLSPDSVLNAAIWDILLHGDISKYEESYENITIPQADVELHATKLFGKNLTFKHRDVGDVSLTFYYNSETKSYTVPVTPEFFSYSPVIRNVAKNGDTYDVAVGYLAPAPSWVEERDKELATLPEKYVIVKLKKEDNGYIVVSCKETDEYETRVNVF